MAGAGGFEPPRAGTKNRCLTAWLRPNKNFKSKIKKIIIVLNKTNNFLYVLPIELVIIRIHKYKAFTSCDSYKNVKKLHYKLKIDND